MDLRKFRRIVGILILLISLGLLLWSLWPLGSTNVSIPISPTDLQLPTPGGLVPSILWFI